jgi:hypothetical protein
MAADPSSESSSSGFGSKYGSMLGLSGALGLVLMLAGLGVIAYFYWQVALGLALVIVGTALLVKALVGNVMSMFGMGGMF